MRIDAFQMYKFSFQYESTELSIPMAATSEAEAMKKLHDLMLGWAGELVAKPVAPTLSPVQLNEEKAPDPFVLQMRIEELVKELIPLKKPKGAQSVERLVKEWTGFTMDAPNFPAIIAELGRLKI